MATLTDIIARLARRSPSLVWRARHFKHFHRQLKLHTSFADIPDLWTYVVRSAINNGNNRRWAMMTDKLAVRDEVASLNDCPVIIYRFSERGEIDHFSFTLNAYTPQWQQIGHYQDPDEVVGATADSDHPAFKPYMKVMTHILNRIKSEHK